MGLITDAIVLSPMSSRPYSVSQRALVVSFVSWGLKNGDCDRPQTSLPTCIIKSPRVREPISLPSSILERYGVAVESLSDYATKALKTLHENQLIAGKASGKYRSKSPESPPIADLSFILISYFQGNKLSTILSNLPVTTSPPPILLLWTPPSPISRRALHRPK